MHSKAYDHVRRIFQWHATTSSRDAIRAPASMRRWMSPNFNLQKGAEGEQRLRQRPSKSADGRRDGESERERERFQRRRLRCILNCACKRKCISVSMRKMYPYARPYFVPAASVCSDKEKYMMNGGYVIYMLVYTVGSAALSQRPWMHSSTRQMPPPRLQPYIMVAANKSPTRLQTTVRYAVEEDSV